MRIRLHIGANLILDAVYDSVDYCRLVNYPSSHLANFTIKIAENANFQAQILENRAILHH